MTIYGLSILLLCTSLDPLRANAGALPQRIACVGREVPGGIFLSSPGAGSYPGQLRTLLGCACEVKTFRLGDPSGMRETGTQNRMQPVDPAALEWLPDVVLVEPGSIDSAVGAVTHGTYTADALVGTVNVFRNLPSKPRVMLLLPLPAPDAGTNADSLLLTGTIPRIRSVAYATGCEMVDLHSQFLGSQDYAPGGAHTSPSAAGLIAARLRDLLMFEEAPQREVAGIASVGGTRSSYYGYECVDFRFNGREAKIVRPKITSRGCPWIWRARFWGHEPQTEIALLERGFHVAYCDVAELFGNDEAIGIWDRFYDMLTGAGLATKAVLEGFSRGGVYVYRWAVHNPSRVACVYADAPVLDLKSWPGGKGKGGGNPVEWQRFKADFGLKSEEEALAFKGNPLDMAEEIARGGFPMLHICGLADVVVPIEENTDPFEKKILSSGGLITVIRKPGIGHHPHSLPNPQPIVEFILDATIRSPLH
jgi:pimeloyl-ACP methyl ester carboxylesterase